MKLGIRRYTIDDLEYYLKRFYSYKKYIYWLIGLLLILTLINFLLPIFLSKKAIAQEVQKRLEEVTKSKVEFSPNIKTRVFPFPKLTISGIYSKGDVELKSARAVIYPAFWSFITGSIHLKEVNLEKAYILWKKNGNKLVDLQNYDGKMVFQGNKISITAHYNPDPNINFSFNLDESDRNNSSVSINNPAYQLAAAKNQFDLKINDFQVFAKDLLSINNGISRLLPQKGEITGSYKFDHNSLVIDSKKAGEYEAKINLALNDQASSNITLFIDNLDLDKHKIEKTSKEENSLQIGHIHGLLGWNVKVKKINYAKNSIVSDLSFKTNDQGYLEILSGNLEGGNFLVKNGSLNENQYHNSISGDLEVKITDTKALVGLVGKEISNINNLSLNAKLELTKESVYLDNIALILNQQGEVRGSIIYNRNPEKVNKISLTSNNLNLDSLGATSYIQPYLAEVIFGDNQQLWELQNSLRYLGQTTEIIFAGNNLLMNQNVINSVHLEAILKPGAVDIKEMKILAGEVADFSFTSSLNTMSLEPILTIGISGDHLDSRFFSQFIGDKNIEKLVDARYNTDKIDFYMPNFTPYEGYITLSLLKLTHNNITLKDTAMQLIFHRNYIEIKEGLGKIFGGDVNFSGNIGYVPPSASMNISFTAIKSEDLLNQLFGANSISGPVSLNAAIVTSGNTYSKWLSMLDSSIAFIGSGITIQNMDIDSIAQQVVNLYNQGSYYNNTPLQNIRDAAKHGDYLHKGSTYFKTIEGNIEINKAMMTFHNITAQSDYDVISSSGNIDLDKKTIDLTNQVMFSLQQNNTVQYNLNINGPIDNPTKTISGSQYNQYY